MACPVFPVEGTDGSHTKWIVFNMSMCPSGLSTLDQSEMPLQWRHNERVSNHQLHYCLLNRLFKAHIKETSKRHWPFLGEFTGDRWIPRTKGQ